MSDEEQRSGQAEAVSDADTIEDAVNRILGYCRASLDNKPEPAHAITHIAELATVVRDLLRRKPRSPEASLCGRCRGVGRCEEDGGYCTDCRGRGRRSTQARSREEELEQALRGVRTMAAKPWKPSLEALLERCWEIADAELEDEQRTTNPEPGPRWAPPSTANGEPIQVGDLLVSESGVYAGRVMRVLEVDAHCGNSSDICVTPEYDARVNEERIRVHGSFFAKTTPRLPIRAVQANEYRDFRCPECGEWLNEHVIVSRHRNSACAESFVGPPLPHPRLDKARDERVPEARAVLCATDYQTVYDAACQAMHEKQMAEERLRNAEADLGRIRSILYDAGVLPPGADAIVEGVRLATQRPDYPRIEARNDPEGTEQYRLFVNGHGVATWPCAFDPAIYASEVARCLAVALGAHAERVEIPTLFEAVMAYAKAREGSDQDACRRAGKALHAVIDGEVIRRLQRARPETATTTADAKEHVQK